MTAIYCSKKLENFLGSEKLVDPIDAEPTLGNWNAHSFHVDGKRCLLFLNSKTCYSVLLACVLKSNIRDLATVFRERLTRQLIDDFQLDERKEIAVRVELRDIRLCPTNNNRNVNGTMNQKVLAVIHYPLHFGPVSTWDELFMSHWLNVVPLSTKVWANRERRGYFFPREAMGEIISKL